MQPLVKNSDSLGHVDYKFPIATPADYRTRTETSHDYHPSIPQFFDCRVEAKINPEIASGDPLIRDAVKETDYERHFVKKYYTKNVDEFYPKCGRCTDVSFTRNVQEKIFSDPPKPRSHFLSETHDSFKMNTLLVPPVETVYPPAPYAICEVKALGRDEQPKIRPEEKGFYKWLDPYMTTNASTHYPFTKEQWEGLYKKDILTFYDIVGVPKSKGFGPKVAPRIDPLVSRKKHYMQDKVPFKLQIQERLSHIPTKYVPHKGLSTTNKETYAPPTCNPIWTYLSNSGVKYTEPLTGTSKLQDLCPPAMYKTEYQTLGSGNGVNAVIDTDHHPQVKTVL